MRISIYVPSFAGLVTGLIISPITLRHPPSTTIKPPPRITERAILEKRDYISVCPTPGNPSGCQLIGVDEVLTEPSGGKYVPECNEHGDCHYIGYEDPVSPITGDSTYIITSASSEVYIFPVPIPLPPNEPAPPPPVEPELNSEFTCKTTSWTTSTETTTYSAVFNDDWLANGISTQGSSTFLQPFGSLATTTAADLSCMVDGAPWYSPTSWCDCGLKTFPTLSPNPSSTGVNCDYTSLPASQLSPKQTSSAPTNKPGVGGKPACQYMLNGDGGLCSYANYCFCDGTAAPPLTTTVGGKTSKNCDYSTQPSSGKCPTPTITPGPTGTVSCAKSGLKIDATSVDFIVRAFCGGGALYDPGSATVDSDHPTAAYYNIPDNLATSQTLDILKAVLQTAKASCKTTTWTMQDSSSACASYIAQITQSCSQGGVVAAGCFDWSVSAFIPGQG